MIVYHNNHLATPEVMTDQSGAVVWKADYKPFGKAEVDPASTVVNDFRFPGQTFDSETGYHYNWNRYYDPETGRYLTADPIGIRGGMNLYAYVGGNPVIYVDPEGLLLETLAQVGAVGPQHAWEAYELKNEAETSTRLSGLPGRWNGPADAYRHCVWSCKMTQKICKKDADLIGKIHEEYGNNSDGEMTMDLHNNNEGIKIGESGKDCEKECMKAVSNGTLQNGPGGFPPSDLYDIVQYP